jgi:hypothetical protein
MIEHVARRRLDGSSIDRLLASPLLLPILAATMLLGAALPAFPAVIDIQIAPPAPRIVEAPPPRPGFVWAPGYYRWDGHQHVWVDGRWIHERRGHHWVAARWDEGRHGHYHFVPGHWERD